MDTQYVVELECGTTDVGEGDVFAAVLAHVAEWLNRNLEPGTVTASILLSSVGEAQDSSHREIRWEPINTEVTRCVFVVIRQPLQNSEVAKFVTEVTPFADAAGTRLRFEMGRETAGIVRPATVEELRRPGLLKSMFRDRSLVLKRRGQVVEYRPVKIDNELSARMLVEVVAELDRLPILIVDASNPGAYKFAQQVSSELGGLLRVALVRAYLVPDINGRLTEFNAQVPIRGAGLGVARRQKCSTPPPVSRRGHRPRLDGVHQQGRDELFGRIADATVVPAVGGG